MYKRLSKDQSSGRFVSLPEPLDLPAALIICALPCMDGDARKIYAPAISWWRQERQCAWCGDLFRPKHSGQGMQRFCGPSCSAKWRMNSPDHKAKVHTARTFRKIKAGHAAWRASLTAEQKEELRQKAVVSNRSTEEAVRRKISQRLQEIGHRPRIRGGNGTALTEPQQLLMDVLGSEWHPEYPVCLGTAWDASYPRAYKLDLANPAAKIGIEVDGHKHRSGRERAKDRKKGDKLASLGWTVLRFWNWDILTWIATGTQTETSISTTLRQHGIRVSPSADC